MIRRRKSLLFLCGSGEALGVCTQASQEEERRRIVEMYDAFVSFKYSNIQMWLIRSGCCFCRMEFF